MTLRIFRAIKIDPFERTVTEFKYENTHSNFDTLSKVCDGPVECVPFFKGKKRELIFLSRADYFNLSLKKFTFANLLLRGISFALSAKTKTGKIQSLPYSISKGDIEKVVKWIE